VVVLPSLRDNLVGDRLGDVHQSTSNVLRRLPRTTLEDLAAFSVDYGKETGNQIGVLRVQTDGSLVQAAGTLAGTSADPLATAAFRSHGIQEGVVNVAGRYAAEVAVPTTDLQYVLVFASPLNDVDRTVTTVRHDILLATVIALPTAWQVGAVAAIALAQRIRRLDRAARRIAAGDLTTPVVDAGRDEIRDLAVAFDSMRRRLERTDRARREFIANASHELRTPLFALGGFLELLEDEEDPVAQHGYIATMRAQMGRLTRLATDLLDLSRLDAGGVDLVLDDVDVDVIADTLVSDFGPAAERRGSTVTRHPGAGRLGFGDENRIAQIGRALVDNGLRHNPPGTVITVSVEPDGDRVALVVHDDGPAVPDAAIDRLFDRFFRGGGGGEGSGLGLAIAHELAGRMGGRLELRQGGGGGKAFWLTLPGHA
jgi:signal transduction histidine kinase